MPQSSIFESNFTHPFVQQPEFVNIQGFGGPNEQTTKLKRKDSFADNAGNFEIGQILFGPSKQKRAKLTPGTEYQYRDESMCTECPEDGAISCSPSAAICNTMVTHMTRTFLEDDKSHLPADQIPAIEKDFSCSMETDDQVDDASPIHDAMKEEQHTLDKEASEVGSHADVQERLGRKSHFYIYRCKPQYYVFH